MASNKSAKDLALALGDLPTDYERAGEIRNDRTRTLHSVYARISELMDAGSYEVYEVGPKAVEQLINEIHNEQTEHSADEVFRLRLNNQHLESELKRANERVDHCNRTNEAIDAHIAERPAPGAQS